MARVLCVGIATLDIVIGVQGYPDEDSEVRASAQSERTGGNAANTAMVLAQLGDAVSWVGKLAADAPTAERDFARHGVDVADAVRVAGSAMPTSYVLLNTSNGSRTIVHYRDLPEYRAADFRKVDVAGLDWIHFEGRAVDQLPGMFRHARAGPGMRLSLEVEKPREGIEDLFGDVDLLLFSRDYAAARGFADAQQLLRSLPRGTLATCTWGARGAWLVDRAGVLTHAPAERAGPIVDTLGAGDVFNAAMIHALCSGRSATQALHDAVALASAQCGHEGLALPA